MEVTLIRIKNLRFLKSIRKVVESRELDLFATAEEKCFILVTAANEPAPYEEALYKILSATPGVVGMTKGPLTVGLG